MQGGAGRSQQAPGAYQGQPGQPRRQVVYTDGVACGMVPQQTGIRAAGVNSTDEWFICNWSR
jgi:hypothetical protein